MSTQSMSKYRLSKHHADARRARLIGGVIPLALAISHAAVAAEHGPMQNSPMQADAEVATHLVNQASAIALFQHSMHDRMGDPALDVHANGARGWARVSRRQLDAPTGAAGLQASGDASLVQVGAELVRIDREAARWHLGVLGGSGRVNSEIHHADKHVVAKGRVQAAHAGVYATWAAHNEGVPKGLYVDAWALHGRVREVAVPGGEARAVATAGSSSSASLEGGYTMRLRTSERSRLFIEPQLQGVRTHYRMPVHAAADGTRTGTANAGWATMRLGVRVFGHAVDGQPAAVQPFVTLNWWYAPAPDTVAVGEAVRTLAYPEHRYELKAGAHVRLRGGWSGWGQAVAQAGRQDHRQVGGELGVSRRW